MVSLNSQLAYSACLWTVGVKPEYPGETHTVTEEYIFF